MADDDEAIPMVARPRRDEVEFDLDAALSSIVAVRAEVPDDAFTAGTLGTERRGNGVVIDASGLVLTIGYLVTEAERVWLTTSQQTATPGHVLAYDQATGFALVQALGRLGLPALPLGSAGSLELGSNLIVAGGLGGGDVLSARLVGKRPFAGYWEYYLEEALFTAPAHPRWGGAACIDEAGRLVGIGSLLVQEATSGGQAMIGNMVVPVDVLAPILTDLLRYGRPSGSPRPWLGLYATDGHEGVVVTGLAARGPAARAGIAEGDVVTALGGAAIDELGKLWRTLWAQGAAGVRVTLEITRDGRRRDVEVTTADREQFLRRPQLH